MCETGRNRVIDDLACPQVQTDRRLLFCVHLDNCSSDKMFKIWREFDESNPYIKEIIV